MKTKITSIQTSIALFLVSPVIGQISPSYSSYTPLSSSDTVSWGSSDVTIDVDTGTSVMTSAGGGLYDYTLLNGNPYSLPVGKFTEWWNVSTNQGTVDDISVSFDISSGWMVSGTQFVIEDVDNAGIFSNYTIKSFFNGTENTASHSFSSYDNSAGAFLINNQPLGTGLVTVGGGSVSDLLVFGAPVDRLEFLFVDNPATMPGQSLAFWTSGQVVPEPSSLMSFAIGLVLFTRRKR